MAPSPILRQLTIIAASGALASAATVSVVNIDPSAVPSSLLSFDEGHGNGMVGWVFEVTRPLTVTQIGWYDAGKDGLSRSFQVGLWMQASGQSTWATAAQLIGSPLNGITIPGGIAADLHGSWRVVSLPAPLVLGAGVYQIGGLDSEGTPDPIRYVLYDTPLDYPDPLVRVGPFFYAGFSPTSFGPSEDFYLAYGLELGPMLFTEIPEPGVSSALILAGLFFPLRRRRHN